ncbi:Rieske (2Fe-2S) protein [Ideonella livida]|uniref:Rieske (2Fe-2S) protein n=1 Tax=Ideonella livida TaxID=2707176 RepID=UPI0028733002|nr:Rieske 2Fe-2S domain-containing protein [Ideonella livida]
MTAPQRLCASDALAERGQAWVFDLRQWGEPVRGFVLRIEGRPVGYLNRCAHVPVEMDWQPGEFLDQDRRWIICSIHGAVYEPADGRCVAGPCRGQRLKPLAVEEREGAIWWRPDATLQPA